MGTPAGTEQNGGNRMNCKKELVLTGFKVQFVDLRDSKPRTPQEEIYTVDREFLDALGLLHQEITDTIKGRYEKIGCKVFSVEKIGPKRVVTLDLNRLFTEAATTPEEVNA